MRSATTHCLWTCHHASKGLSCRNHPYCCLNQCKRSEHPLSKPPSIQTLIQATSSKHSAAHLTTETGPTPPHCPRLGSSKRHSKSAAVAATFDGFAEKARGLGPSLGGAGRAKSLADETPVWRMDGMFWFRCEKIFRGFIARCGRFLSEWILQLQIA